MTKIKNIIFDFDGTLVDTAPVIIRTMQAAIRKLGLPEKTEEECRATIGLRLEEIPAVLWPENHDLSEKYAATYRRIFDEMKGSVKAVCFPDVAEGLRTLRDRGFRMAIASSRSHRSLEEYVGHFGLADCFAMLIGGNDVEHGKPSPEPVTAILDAQGWNAAETLTVGDAPVDIMMGRGAGTPTCGVTYGNSSYEELDAVHPDFILTSFRRFMAMLP